MNPISTTHLHVFILFLFKIHLQRTAVGTKPLQALSIEDTQGSIVPHPWKKMFAISWKKAAAD